MSGLDGGPAEAEPVMSTYTVYRVRRDGSAGFAVRRFDIIRGEMEPRPGPLLGEASTIGGARAIVPLEADVCMVPSEDDDLSIVETWL